ncbi:hypothetical protein C8J57DRAFT_1242259 [Mycena rebaudengoi]|nr:hypothetical protein C8J57DRAFT_1242259 [Mycena rebaudengoi]
MYDTSRSMTSGLSLLAAHLLYEPPLSEGIRVLFVLSEGICVLYVGGAQDGMRPWYPLCIDTFQNAPDVPYETLTIVPPRLSNDLMLSVTAAVPNTLTAFTSWNEWVMTAALQ